MLINAMTSTGLLQRLAPQKLVSRLITASAHHRAMFNVQDEADFKKRVIESGIPVLVDFHAQWCGPCKLLAPRIEKVIASKGERMHLAKVDIDDHSDLALEYGVSAVPSVLAIKNGQVVDKFVGLQEENRIESFINGVIGE